MGMMENQNESVRVQGSQDVRPRRPGRRGQRTLSVKAVTRREGRQTPRSEGAVAADARGDSFGKHHL